MTPAESGAEIHGLTLKLDGEALHVEHNSPSDLAYTIGAIGREAIIRSIEANYAHTQDQNPGAQIVRPSVHAITLGAKRNTILTPFGQHNRTSINRSIIELQSPFHDYWRAVNNSGFTPEIRRFTDSRSRDMIALLMRNPDTDPTPITPLADLPAALGYVEPAATRTIKTLLQRAFDDGDATELEHQLDSLFSEQNKAIVRQTETYGLEAGQFAKIGMLVNTAHIFLDIQGDEYYRSAHGGYLSALTEALEAARGLSHGELIDLLELEIGRVLGDIASPREK